MANPPFNVDKVDKEKIKDDPRYALLSTQRKIASILSPLGQIPDGWEATTLGDLAVNERRSVQRRKSIQKQLTSDSNTYLASRLL